MLNIQYTDVGVSVGRYVFSPLEFSNDVGPNIN